MPMACSPQCERTHRSPSTPCWFRVVTPQLFTESSRQSRVPCVIAVTSKSAYYDNIHRWPQSFYCVTVKRNMYSRCSLIEYRTEHLVPFLHSVLGPVGAQSLGVSCNEMNQLIWKRGTVWTEEFWGCSLRRSAHVPQTCQSAVSLLRSHHPCQSAKRSDDRLQLSEKKEAAWFTMGIIHYNLCMHWKTSRLDGVWDLIKIVHWSTWITRTLM